MSAPMRKGELNLGLHLSFGEMNAKEAPACGIDKNGTSEQASPWLKSSSVTTGSQGSINFSARPVAAEPDPLQLTIAPQVPDINLNLLPTESQAAPVSGKTWSGMETANPFERPLLQRVGRKDPQFGPFILESSEVAREYAQRQREAAAEANNKRMVIGEGLDAGPAKRKYRYRWPAKTVANINEKIEQLKKEALRDPDERRSVEVIEAEIGALQAKKDLIHARVSGQLGDGQGSSSARGGRAPPPSSGN